ncbi:MAG TPA: maltotransferase domain-containing protein, partial [Terriglobia bacterium]|nr:maltotransferase domain-containing protein [Terriglobia bacterium]
MPASRPARVVITHVEPEVEGGRFPARRIVGDEVVVAADIFADGHQALQAELYHRHSKDTEWSRTPMRELPNDRWTGDFRVGKTGRYEFMLQAWVDRFATWRRDFKKKLEAGRAAEVDLRAGSELVYEARTRASGADGHQLAEWGKRLYQPAGALAPDSVRAALDEGLAELMAAHPDRRRSTTYEKTLAIDVDAERSRSSAWYEMFPRSASPEPGRHGTFQDCEDRLAYVASMGFDVLYLPPIHPIGTTERKGKNGISAAAPSEPGSVWAVGSAEGGHMSVHPELGTLDDFRRLVRRAREFGIEVALDLAYQCSPDHPYVTQHPEWFRRRPDG